MKKDTHHLLEFSSVASFIRSVIDQGGERIWRLEDFLGMPFTAVAQTLSRLSRSGVINRLSKGIYYKPKQTAFGSSSPNPSTLKFIGSCKHTLFPAGPIAAHLLGFTTQIPKLDEISTCSSSLPLKLIGKKTIVHTRRPASWSKLTETEAALLEFMRGKGLDSELSPKKTITRLLKLLSEEDRYHHLVLIADSEPPRIRALLGALGEILNENPLLIDQLHQSLNPLSRFDFGFFSILSNSKKWQSKELNQHEAL